MKKKYAMKFTSIVLCLLVLSGCSGAADEKTQQAADSNKEGEEAQSEETASAESEETAPTESEEGEQMEEEKVEYTVPDVSVDSYEVPDTEGFAFVKDMKLGWNLGNTFDAFNENGFTNELDSEKSWVGVFTTKEMIDDIKAAGFRTIRIPVTWHIHLTDDNYTISEAWLNRVQEVVDFAMDNDMYVILNIHHDNSEDFLFPDSEHLEQSVKYVESIWTQLAGRFSDYSEHLIFEAMNEPRLVGSTYEWWIDPNNEECKDAIECVNTLNQTFVDVVRKSGGNNASRYLMVPGYCASADGALNDGFALPKDEAENKLFVSVHAYTPYNFALQLPNQDGSVSSFDQESRTSTNDIVTFMDGLYNKYISQGIPVVIGEFGALDKDNYQDRINFSAYYIAAARARGITCVWWDNNAFSGSGENFGIYYRQQREWTYPEIVEALLKYAE